MGVKNYFLIFLIILFAYSCKTKRATLPLFELTAKTGINFTNNVSSSKDFNVLTYRNFYNGGGVAIGDINNDGLTDVFFTANQGSNKLYLNKGNWQFEDASKKAGFTNKEDWSTGVVMVDLNNDGWLDIYVCNAGYINGKAPENKLYINNHDLSFTESAAKYGLSNHGGYCTHAAFFDYDEDGDLDCFILNNSFIPVNTLNYANKRDLRAADWPVADFLKGGGDHLLKNDNGFFIDVSKEAGIYGSLIGFGLGITVGDINGDNYPDIYISNDFFEKDYLYINQRNGTFKEDLEQCMGHISLASMGADIADINNDGYPDIFTTDMLPGDEYRLKTTSSFDNFDVFNYKQHQGFYNQFMQNTLQLNNRDGKFCDIANYAGVNASDWSWGGLLFDADNDGYTDLYICNGINRDVTDQDFIDYFANDVVQSMSITGKKEEVDSIIKRMPSTPLKNKAFRNNGNLKFSDTGETWGFTQPSFSNGAAYGDLDNDGDLDLVINNVNQPAFVYRNNSREFYKNNFIGIYLKGKDKNTYALGSTIKIYAGKQIFTREIIPSRGFQSSIDYKSIIGLGSITKVDSMIIIWPNRCYTKYDLPSIDTIHVIQQPVYCNLNTEEVKSKKPLLLQESQNSFEKHREDDYVDFYTERNLPEMLSREGPKIANGDVNGDGLEDVYIGGAKGQSGQLYLQTPAGTFVKKDEATFKQYQEFEDVAVLFFDADKDGDLDLFVGSGGNNVQPGSPELQHRLYKNDGKGDFTIDIQAFPSNNMNISVAIVNDFDYDGDQDLFVGSRSVPYSYGITPESYLYLNDGQGHFTDVAPAMNQGISKAGMVTSAVWADVMGDKQKELIITGEWMATRIFKYKGNKFEEQANTNLENLYGWWQTVAAADVNGDGLQDLIVGNIGGNFYLRPDVKNPVKLWLTDLDRNGSKEQFLTRTIGGRDMPVFLKKDITDQFPGLKKQNLRHSDYATKTIQDLFPKDVMDKAVTKEFNYSMSIVAINNGKGGFTVQVLPVMVQLSSVNAVCSADVNNDNIPDLVLGGNMFHFPPQFGRLDANYGQVLLNNGKGIFTLAEPGLSELNLRGETKDIKEIDGKDKRYLLVVQNDQLPILYQIKK